MTGRCRTLLGMRLPLKILAVTAVGTALLLIAGSLLIPPAAKSALANGSRAAFGVPSSVAGVHASPGLSTTSVGFSEFRLDSPEGFTDPILTIGSLDLGVGTSSLFGATKAVNHFVLEDLVLTLEQDGLNSNLVPLLQHFRSRSSGVDVPDHAPEGAGHAASDGGSESAGPRLNVGRVQFRGVSARLRIRGIPGLDTMDRTFAVPDFTEDFSERGGGEGASIPELAGALMQSLKTKALQSAEGEVPPEFLTALESALDGGLEGGLKGALGGLESAAEKGVEEGGAALREAAQKAIQGSGREARSVLKEGFSGLLGGKEGGR